MLKIIVYCQTLQIHYLFILNGIKVLNSFSYTAQKHQRGQARKYFFQSVRRKDHDILESVKVNMT